MKKTPHLPKPFLDLARGNMPLLQSQNVTKKRDTVELNLSGYADVMFLIADIVKVVMLALESNASSSRIPEPETNISGVLAIVLDLIPYEEADLLDMIREAVLNPQMAEEEWIYENLFLMPPSKGFEGYRQN